MNPRSNVNFISAVLLCLTLFSCEKNAIPVYSESAIFPQTEQEKEAAALHTVFAAMLQQIYQNTEAFREVQAAIWSGYYEDERVLLKALLAPGSHPLYSREAFTQFNILKGNFKKQFDQLISQPEFALLQKHLAKAGYQAGADWSSNSIAQTKTGLQVNANSGIDPDPGSAEALSIYFPYSENHNPLTVDDGEKWKRATIVAADREANQAPGFEPVNCATITCYNPVTVDDDYCETNIVHIAGSGGVAATPTPVVPQPALNMVMLGSVVCKRQYDHLISFTGNGGGSEIRFIRADSYLEQNSNGQITAPQNVVAVNFSRKEIRKGRWKTVNSIWDSNWEADNPEQVFAIYEEDNEGSRKLSGSISAKLKIFTIEPVNYEFTVQTKDDIIRQLGWKRNSFFAFNQGGLNNGCSLSNGFTVYDCQSPVAYTMPVQKQ